MKKHDYVITINHGKTVRHPLCYSFGPTKGIELHISKNKAVICFKQSSLRAPEALLSSQDHLCTDAIKKVFLFHMFLFSAPLDAKSIDMTIDGTVHPVLQRKPKDPPLVYSMVDRIPDHPFPDSWHDPDVLDTLLSMPKSAYDGRMNAVIALLMGKTRVYRSEKAFYLWMAMNGFYNYIADQLNIILSSRNEKPLSSENKKQIAMCKIVGLCPSSVKMSDSDKSVLRQKAMSTIRYLDDSPEALYEKLRRKDTCDFTTRLEKLLAEYNTAMDPMTFLTVWLPYQIRCTYFHNNQAMPILLYTDEPLLKALEFTNYFTERLLEENLPLWLKVRSLSPEDQLKLYAIYSER